jgi:predicted nucleic acid-binding protein
MELVVDTNVLYTFFWKKSFVRRVLMRMDFRLYSPEFALEEINAHESDILKKTALSAREFKEIKSDLAIAVEFIPLEEYKELLDSAFKIAPDGNDVDFFALAMKMKVPLWSNDSLLKKQKKVLGFCSSAYKRLC